MLITVACFLCFEIFESLCLEQILQVLVDQHTEKIRLPDWKYQQRMMNIAQTVGKKIIECNMLRLKFTAIGILRYSPLYIFYHKFLWIISFVNLSP